MTAPDPTAGEREIKVAIRTLLPGLRVGNYAERWSPQSPAVLALNILCQYVGEPVEPAGDEIDTHIPTTHHRRPAGNPPPAVAASTGTSEDAEALAEDVFGAMEALGIEDAAMADARFIADGVSDWLAAREAAARAEERERIAQSIEAERDLDPRTPFGLGLASAAKIAREAR